jgi:hypothetical protein
MRKIGIVIAVLVVVVAGAAYYALSIYPQQRFRSELDQAIQRLPQGYAASYKTADYAVAAGRATVTGIKVTGTGTDSFEVTIDQFEVVKPALDFGKAWADAAANPAALKPEAALPLGESASAKGIAFKAPMGSGSIDSLRIGGPRLYPWAWLHTPLPSWTEAAAAAQHQPPQLEDVLPMLKLEAAMMLGIGYDRYEASNLKVVADVPATPTTPATTVSYVFAKMSAGRFERGSGEGLAGEGISATANELGTFQAERVSMSGIDVRQPFSQLLDNQPPALAMLDGLAIGRLEYGGMSAKLPNGTTIPLGTFTMSKIGFSRGMPVSAELAYSGLRLSSGQIPLPDVMQAYQQLGIDTATLSLGVAYSWDLDKKVMSLRDVSLKIDELGALTLSVDASDVAPDDIAQMKARLAHAKLQYADASLAERALRVYAQQTGSDPAALREQFIAMVQQQGADLGDSPAIVAAVKAIVAFLGAPKSLTVELSPPTPVDLATLQGAGAMPPPELATMLGLKVTANQ